MLSDRIHLFFFSKHFSHKWFQEGIPWFNEIQFENLWPDFIERETEA